MYCVAMIYFEWYFGKFSEMNSTKIIFKAFGPNSSLLVLKNESDYRDSNGFLNTILFSSKFRSSCLFVQKVVLWADERRLTPWWHRMFASRHVLGTHRQCCIYVQELQGDIRNSRLCYIICLFLSSWSDWLRTWWSWQGLYGIVTIFVYYRQYTVVCFKLQKKNISIKLWYHNR